MTDLMQVLVIICTGVTAMAIIMIYKVLEDCNKRIERRQRQQELRRAKLNDTDSTSASC